MDAVFGAAFWFVVVAAYVVFFWAESRLALRWLRRDLTERGCELLHARWRGPYLRVWSRQVGFAVRVQCEDERQLESGTAYVGGSWMGALSSVGVEYAWDDDEDVPH